MKREHLPDPGAEITVHLRTGKTFTGCIATGHVFAPDTVLCLAISGNRNSNQPFEEDGNAEHLWQYIDLDCVEAWTWDCRP